MIYDDRQLAFMQATYLSAHYIRGLKSNLCCRRGQLGVWPNLYHKTHPIDQPPPLFLQVLVLGFRIHAQFPGAVAAEISQQFLFMSSSMPCSIELVVTHNMIKLYI